MKMMKIGIVGCGAIGSSLAKIIAQDFRQSAKLVALYDTDLSKARELSRRISGNTKLAVDNLSVLLKKSGFLIEASSAKSSWNIAKRTALAGKGIMIMSVGGIIDKYNELFILASRKKIKVYIPSGAICGIDGLKAAKLSGLERVILTTRKHPRAFQGVEYLSKKRIKLDTLRKDKVLFFGPAREAVKYFPQNINVAAVLSLSGPGADKTYVKLVASPKVRNNIHEIEIHSKAGNIFSRTENVVHPDNPKTSYLAVLAAAATLKQVLEPIKIGT